MLFLHAVQNNSNFWQGGWHKWLWASKSEENFAEEINVSLMYSCMSVVSHEQGTRHQTYYILGLFMAWRSDKGRE